MNNEYHPDEELEEDESTEFYAIRPNKTQIKKEIAAISDMAEEISQLSPTHIAEFELPEAIERALLDARKRLIKYITAQLRNIEIEPVQEKLARLQNRSAHAVREHHQAEQWRDRLLEDNGAGQLTELISEFPEIDSQHLRQLQRNAQKEAKEEKPPKSARLIYKYLKDIISSQD